jgi:hypothetical protein
LEEREEVLKELLSFAESDARSWNEMARNCESLANKLGADEKTKLLLLCEVCRERAKVHTELVARIRLGLRS